MQQSIILSTAYLPPIAYFQKIKQADGVYIEKHEYYIKQSYRNRCRLLSANGVVELSIPIVNSHNKQTITDVQISYAEKWQQQHWRTIEYAYRNTPYFLYYEDDLAPFYEKKYSFLFDFNMALIAVLMKSFKLPTEIYFTEEYSTEGSPIDYRNSIHPKNKIQECSFKTYPQLYTEGKIFKSNLSVIDLLFNVGTNAGEYL
ncbi:MAG: WbqC family protein [Bacteroidia bacterium]